MSRFIGKYGFSLTVKGGLIIEKFIRMMPNGGKHTKVSFQLGGWQERKEMAKAWTAVHQKGSSDV